MGSTQDTATRDQKWLPANQWQEKGIGVNYAYVQLLWQYTFNKKYSMVHSQWQGEKTELQTVAYKLTKTITIAMTQLLHMN